MIHDHRSGVAMKPGAGSTLQKTEGDKRQHAGCHNQLPALTRVSGVSSALLTSRWIRNRIMMNRIGVTVMQQLLLRLRRWNAAFLRISAPA